MKDDGKRELMKLYGIDDAAADSVIGYIKELKAPSRKQNDLALAVALNDRTTRIIDIAADAVKDGIYTSNMEETRNLNRSYVLLVNELRKIYERNRALTDISRQPIWHYIDIIEDNENEIYDHIWDRNNDAGQAHNAQVNKLCIIAGIETPKYTAALKKMVDEADEAISAYRKWLFELNRQTARSNRDWFIPEYGFAYGSDGTLLVNGISGVLKVKKAHAGSASEKLLEQATKRPNELFKPDLGQYSRNISTTLSGLGFSGTLRKLFFPVVSNSKGIKFRSVVDRNTADAEGINTFDLDAKLKQLGAKVEAKPLSLDDIPF